MPFYNEPDSRERKFSNLIHSAMSDVQGNLWMCTYSKGLEKISFRRSEFEQILPNENKTNGLYENEVRALLQDSDTLNWIATKDGTLYILDKNMKKLGTLGKSGRLNQGDSFGGIVYAIHQDSKGRIWLGTKGDGH